MSIELPPTFGYRVSNLTLTLDRYEAEVSESNKQGLMREALAMSCAMLSDLDLHRLEEDLGALLGSPGSKTRADAADILRRTDLYAFFELVEEQILDRAGVTFPARERVLDLLSQFRLEAAKDVEDVAPHDLTKAVGELRSWVCEFKERYVEAATTADERNQRAEAYTRVVNTLGTATIVVNTAVGFAGAASILFLPVISVAACAASAALGGIAARIKSAEQKPTGPYPSGDPGIALRARWPKDRNRYKL
jgi:hypothetical protein